MSDKIKIKGYTQCPQCGVYTPDEDFIGMVCLDCKIDNELYAKQEEQDRED